MMGNSIRFRLWLAATVSILVALAIAGVGLRYLFELNVERRIVGELTVDLNELIGATAYSADGQLYVQAPLTDPRFSIPLSGHYWQVEDITSGNLVRSRSLWDATLALHRGETGNGELKEIKEFTGPQGELAIAVARTVIDSGGRSFRAIVAENHRSVEVAVREYVRDLAPALIVLALALMATFFIQITVGLAPLESLRVAVRNVVAQRASRLDVAAPREVQPLADEINRLLEAQDKALMRARSRATDLAHGLKTPLQVLSADIRALRGKGETELADEIEKSAGTIRRHIERELARDVCFPAAGRACASACLPDRLVRRILAYAAIDPADHTHSQDFLDKPPEPIAGVAGAHRRRVRHCNSVYACSALVRLRTTAVARALGVARHNRVLRARFRDHQTLALRPGKRQTGVEAGKAPGSESTGSQIPGDCRLMRWQRAWSGQFAEPRPVF